MTDTDLNKAADQNIIFNCNVDCPECAAVFDQNFDTGCKDEDGLADVSAGEIVALTSCPECRCEFEAVYSGWINYGDA